MNVLDLAVLALVALCAFAGYRRGLIRTVYGLVSFFIAFFLASRLYSPVARILRGTGLFSMLQNNISSTLNLERVVGEHTAARQAEIIDTLPLPAALRELLHSYNTPNMYELLQVDTIDAYISGFFANMVINAIAIIGVFMLVLVLLSIAGVALDIVGRLPVIYTFNRAGGLIFGLGMGAVLVWLCVVVMTLLSTATPELGLYYLMRESFVVRWVLNTMMMPQLTAVA
ncbi:MAG: CvpA family protein [Defluviitaleaceae bacterium]|nr:CvpA family protein [Defluviitaleaceae bacterium]